MQNFLNIIQAIFGVIFVLFLPGFALTFVFFGRGKVDALERLALSFTLSVAVVPLLAFYLNLIGVKIRYWTVVLEVLIVILLSFAISKIIGNLEKTNEHENKKRG